MDSDIEWACKWVGWHCLDGIIHAQRYDLDTDRSINDLAEAVRVKYGQEPEGAVLDDGELLSRLCAEWFNEGPLGFIKAVREVINNG